jgi:hypothetical protein
MCSVCAVRQHGVLIQQCVRAKDLAIRFFHPECRYPFPIFRMPPTYFGYNHVCVMNGIARSALAALKALAPTKTSTMPPGCLRDDPQAQ